MAEEPQQDPGAEEEIAAILAVLAVGASVDATARSLAKVLKVPFEIAWEFLTRIGKAALASFTRSWPKSTPVAVTHRANLRYRAAFIRNALRRIAAAPDKQIAMQRELGFWKAHKRAQARRLKMAKRVSVAQKRWGSMLGWYSVMDARTSGECRAAHGRNFTVWGSDIPVIGWPGTVHPHCRCLPGPPHPGGKMVNDSLTVRRHGTTFYRR